MLRCCLIWLQSYALSVKFPNFITNILPLFSDNPAFSPFAATAALPFPDRCPPQEFLPKDRVS